VIRARAHVRKIENNTINTEELFFFFCDIFVKVVVISLLLFVVLFAKKGRIKEEEMKTFEIFFFVVQNTFCKTHVGGEL